MWWCVCGEELRQQYCTSEKRMTVQFTFPANGIRNGSVQYIPRRANAIRDVLTAIDNSIGNSGGITEVIISEQLKKSLYLLLVGSSRPCLYEVKVSLIDQLNHHSSSMDQWKIFFFFLPS